MSNTGLSTLELSFIRKVFAPYTSLSRVRIFGSRAKGNYTPRSDIDIAYEGTLSHAEFSQIWSQLTYDAPFLYKTDLVDYSKAQKSLQEHIDRVGVDL